MTLRLAADAGSGRGLQRDEEKERGEEEGIGKTGGCGCRRHSPITGTDQSHLEADKVRYLED